MNGDQDDTWCCVPEPVFGLPGLAPFRKQFGDGPRRFVIIARAVTYGAGTGSPAAGNARASAFMNAMFHASVLIMPSTASRSGRSSA